MKKYDGIIEAVHYKDGKAASFRLFERRGATWSDRVILPRETVVERLKSGRKLAIGKRIEFMGGTFETGAEVKALGKDGTEVLTTGKDAQRDELEGLPVF